MIDFEDGPAIGVSLALSRAPILLRVVQDEHGNWDGLDQLEDEAADGERVYVYRRMSGPVFVCARGRGGYSDVSARYRWLRDVDAAELGLAETATWRAWAEEYGLELVR